MDPENRARFLRMGPRAYSAPDCPIIRHNREDQIPAMNKPLHIVVLAAGQGSRMKSRLPKVLHRLAGRPMLQHVLETATSLKPEGTHVVIGHGADQVRTTMDSFAVAWAEQTEQLGTGHAVAQALPAVPDDARVLVLYGDVPLIDRNTLENLVARCGDRELSILTVHLDDPTGYGRIVRDSHGRILAIVEQKDASESELQIREVNTGILAVSAGHLKRWLPQLSNGNAQGEYYLTDIIAMAVADDVAVSASQPTAPEEVQGVNNRAQLAALERWYQGREAARLMAEGATLADPARVDVRGNVSTGTDVFIDVNVVLEGRVELGADVQIGPNCVIRNAILGDGVEVQANSLIDGARVDAGAQVGPFARLRPGAELRARAKVGNFVEVKKAVIGEGSKVNHLSYVGDAELGRDVNVGAGTITCNYDGVNKHRTLMGDGVFIGSNSSLVAPVSIGDRATVGAGSTITRDVEPDQLAIGRGRQRNIDDWPRPEKKSK